MSIASEMFEPYNATLWEPDTHNYAYGTPAELEQKLKLVGINLRREILKIAHDDIDAWTALVSPPSVHQVTRTLMDLIAHISKEDKEQFTPLGETDVVMPLRMMEKYLLPTIKIMEFIHEKGLTTSQEASKLQLFTLSSFSDNSTPRRELTPTYKFSELLRSPTIST